MKKPAYITPVGQFQAMQLFFAKELEKTSMYFEEIAALQAAEPMGSRKYWVYYAELNQLNIALITLSDVKSVYDSIYTPATL